MLVNNRATLLMRRLDKYAIPHKTLHKAEEILADPEKKLSLGTVKHINQGLYQLLLWMKAVVTLHKLVNPLLFISAEYVRKRLSPDEVQTVEYIYQNIENWKTIYSLRLRANQGQSTLSGIVTEARKSLSADFEEYVNLGRWEDSNKICLFYFTAREKVPPGARPALIEKALTEFFNCFKDVESFGFEAAHFTATQALESSGALESNPSLNASNIMRTLKASKRNINIEATLLDHKIFADGLLWFVPLEDLPACSLVNKHWHKGVKMHLILRAIQLISETKEYQDTHRELADRINNKRRGYYDDYELEPPTKDSAMRKMNVLTSKVLLLLIGL
jgi:hypothetical protein